MLRALQSVVCSVRYPCRPSADPAYGDDGLKTDRSVKWRMCSQICHLRGTSYVVAELEVYPLVMIIDCSNTNVIIKSIPFL